MLELCKQAIDSNGERAAACGGWIDEGRVVHAALHLGKEDAVVKGERMTRDITITKAN